jgi:hypothetical protein
MTKRVELVFIYRIPGDRTDDSWRIDLPREDFAEWVYTKEGLEEAKAWAQKRWKFAKIEVEEDYEKHVARVLHEALYDGSDEDSGGYYV